MANPLKSAENFFGTGDIPPGETRIVYAKDKQGNIIKTIEILRTERDYVYDLCDAYNAARSPAPLSAGVEWYVANGALLIGHSFEAMKANARRTERRNETERARFNRNYLENCRPTP